MCQVYLVVSNITVQNILWVYLFQQLSRYLSNLAAKYCRCFTNCWLKGVIYPRFNWTFCPSTNQTVSHARESVSILRECTQFFLLCTSLLVVYSHVVGNRISVVNRTKANLKAYLRHQHCQPITSQSNSLCHCLSWDLSAVRSTLRTFFHMTLCTFFCICPRWSFYWAHFHTQSTWDTYSGKVLTTQWMCEGEHERGLDLTSFACLFSQRCRVQTNAPITCGSSPAPRLFLRNIGWPCRACCATSLACARPRRPTCSAPARLQRSSARPSSDISPPGTCSLRHILHHSWQLVATSWPFFLLPSCEPSPEAHIRIIEVLVTSEWNDSQAAPGKWYTNKIINIYIRV